MIRAFAVALGLAVVAAACGLPSDESPRAISEDALAESLRPGEATTTTTIVESDTEVAVYLVDEAGQLRQVFRPVEDELLSTLIDAALRRPTEEEQAEGLSTVVPEATERIDVPRLVGSELAVALDDGFYSLEGSNLARAAAQVTFSATATPFVREVRFVDAEGATRAIPTSEGVVPDPARPMRRSDFADFDPLVSGTTGAAG